MEMFTGRVLVVGRTPQQAGALSARLARYGATTSTAAGEAAARTLLKSHQYDGIVIDGENGQDEESALLAAALRHAAAPLIVPVLVVLGAGAEGLASAREADVVMRGPVHPAQICARLQLAKRVSVMEEEARLRAATLRQFGQQVDLSLNSDDYRAAQILFIGHPSPFFLGLERAVRTQGGSITAAFSTFTAFDYLHERDFDAVVCNAIDNQDACFVIANAFRRNTRLFHTPLCLFVDLDDFSELERAFESGFSNLSYFYRLFRERRSTTPRVYRDMHVQPVLPGSNQER